MKATTMTKEMIDLNRLTEDGRIHNLSGHDRGLAAREEFKLDKFDDAGARVDIVVPDHIYAVSPSFVQGLLAASMQRAGLDRTVFFSRYQFVASDLIKRQFERGISAILTNRDFSTH